MNPKKVPQWNLLRAHKILIVFALLLGLSLVVWGLVHSVYRHEADAYGMLILGAIVWPIAAIYMIKLARNPPVH